MAILRPYRSNEVLQGAILKELIYEAKTTSQLAYEIRENLTHVRREVVHLHHLGVIEPIGYRHKDGEPPPKLYFKDYLWVLTVHGKNHNYHDPDCRACRIRERILLKTVPPHLKLDA